MRPPTSFTEPIKRRLMAEVGGTDPRAYELDHRVPIEVGGCPDCESNLWLEHWRDPRHHSCDPATMMDAACKDRLENFVHRQVCKGLMTLEEGQQVFLGDWIAGFNTYIQP